MTPKSRTEVFLYLFLVTGLVWAVGMAALIGGSAGSWIGFGAAFGLLAGLFGTPRLVGDTRSVDFPGDKEQFVAHLNVACSQIGYAPSGRTNDFLNYKPTGDSTFSLGPIKLAPASYLALGVQLSDRSATLVGPHKSVVDVLQRLTGG